MQMYSQLKEGGRQPALTLLRAHLIPFVAAARVIIFEARGPATTRCMRGRQRDDAMHVGFRGLPVIRVKLFTRI